MGRIPADRTEHFRFLANADMTIVAAMDTWEKDKWYITVNSVLWEFYTDVETESAQFSSDGKHLSLLARRDGQSFLVRDDREVANLGAARCSGLRYSADGQHFVCVQEAAEGRSQVLLDGVPSGKPAKEIRGVCFSPDSQHAAWTAMEDGNISVVKDGKALVTLPASIASPVVFAGEGNAQMVHCVLATTTHGQPVVVRMDDGAIGATIPLHNADGEATAVQISDDAQKMAWAERTPRGMLICTETDSRAVPVRVDRIAISPNNAHVAWVGTQVGQNGAADRVEFYVDLALAGYGEAGAQAVRFAQDDHVRFSAGKKKMEAFRNRDGWEFLAIPTGDGTLAVYSRDVLALTGNWDDLTVLDARMAETGKAYVVYQNRPAVQAGDKIMEEVVRVALTRGK